MPASALWLTLAAALVHAGWNLILSGSEDTHAATAVAIVFGAALFAPVAALHWQVRAAAVPYITASSALEGLYLVLLATGYARAAMGFVYPIARGSAPVFVAAVAVLALGTRIAAPGVIGVLLVAAGIVLVRGLRARHGIAHAAPLAYIEIVFASAGVAYLLGVARVVGLAPLRAAVGLDGVRRDRFLRLLWAGARSATPRPRPVRRRRARAERGHRGRHPRHLRA